MLRGRELDEAIEDELKAMLEEGIENSPISHSILHLRLVTKGFIKGGLSTLSTPKRKKLIQKYTTEQLIPLNLKEREQQLYINKKTRLALLDTNTNLKSKIAELENELNQNTVSLINIINQIKLKTDINIDDFLAPHLIAKYQKTLKLQELK